MDTDNVEKLISAIHKRKALWDPDNEHYTIQYIKEALWNDVVAEINEPNVSVYHLKRRWKGLRDTFSKELRRRNFSKNVNNSVFTTTWPYFKNLLFLYDPIVNKKADTKPKEANASNYPNMRMTSTLAHTNTGKLLTSRSVLRDDQPSTSGLRMHTDTARVQNKPIKNKHFRQTPGWLRGKELPMDISKEGSSEPEGESDSDFQFLVSLLPYLKKVSQSRKMTVRTKLQQVFIDEETGEMSCSSTESSPATAGETPPDLEMLDELLPELIPF